MIGTNEKAIAPYLAGNESGWMVFIRKNGDHAVMHKLHSRRWIEVNRNINGFVYHVGKVPP